MLDEFQNDLEINFAQEELVSVNKMKEYINNLIMYTGNVDLLTNYYTELMMEDNIVYIFTRLSQNPVFATHFPEFYIKNEHGENIINCQQNTPYHRYGVFKHILYTIEYIGKNNLKITKDELKILKWTMLLHDIGKSFVKIINPDKTDSFAGHEDMSVDIATNILDRFSFTDEEKHIIIKLIKYHDKYLNEGEVTYDNLRFLASELYDKEDLFKLLIEVKIADNKAKSFDVNNKFEAVLPKYLSFVNEYFETKDKYKTIENKDDTLNLSFDDYNEKNINKDIFEENLDITINELKETNSTIEFTDKIFDKIYNNIVDGMNLTYYYQPIIDINEKIIFAYEVFPVIKNEYGFSMQQIYRKARELDKYNKIQQMVLINSINQYKHISKIGRFEAHFSIDIDSYDSYINKPRLFEMAADNEIVIGFSNYQKKDYTEINTILEEFKKRKCKILLDDISRINTDYLEYYKKNQVKYNIDAEYLNEYLLKEINNVLTNTLLDNSKLIVNGIKNKESLQEIINAGVRYVQGDFIGKIENSMTMTETKIKKILNLVDASDDMII